MSTTATTTLQRQFMCINIRPDIASCPVESGYRISGTALISSVYLLHKYNECRLFTQVIMKFVELNFDLFTESPILETRSALR